MPKLSPEQVLYMINNKGMKQAEIAELFGTSRQRVHQLAIEAGHVPVTSTISDNMPWEVEDEFKNIHLYIKLRLHARLMLLGVDNFNIHSKKSLSSLYNHIYDYNVTLDYSPSYPPILGVTKNKGFALLPRRPEDENFIIHMREGVNITEIGNKIWRLPETKPSL